MKWIAIFLSLSMALTMRADRRSLLIARNNSTTSNPEPPVAGFTLWLDAQDLSTMFTNGIGTVATVPAGSDLSSARVGKWVDKSNGGTNHVFEAGDISLEDTRPYLTNGVFGTQKALRFAQNVAGRSALQSSNNTVFGTAAVTDSFTLLAVGALQSSADVFDIFFSWKAATFEMLQNNASLAILFATPNFLATTGAIVENKGYVFTYVFDNAANTLTCFTNLSQASVVTSVTDNNPGSAEFAIGRRVDATVANFWHGFIGDVIVYPSALSGANLTNSITFLKDKYGF